MQDRTATNYPVDEEAIRDLLRRKLLDDIGRGDGGSLGSRFTGDGEPGRRAPRRAGTAHCPLRSIPRSKHTSHLTATHQERDGPSREQEEVDDESRFR